MAQPVHLRPLSQHRSPESQAGRRPYRAGLRIAISAFAVLAFAVFAACGDDDDDDSTNGGATAPGGTPTAATAAEMIPDLSTLGFEPSTDALPGVETPNTKIALFEDPGGAVPSVRLEVAFAPTVEGAQGQFSALAEALKNPPPGLFGPDAKQTDGTAVFQGDQSRSYQTDKPDNEGTLVFSDIHRFGRAIVIMYTIGQPGTETETVRKQVAEMLAAKAPR